MAAVWLDTRSIERHASQISRGHLETDNERLVDTAGRQIRRTNVIKVDCQVISERHTKRLLDVEGPVRVHASAHRGNRTHKQVGRGRLGRHRNILRVLGSIMTSLSGIDWQAARSDESAC